MVAVGFTVTLAPSPLGTSIEMMVFPQALSFMIIEAAYEYALKHTEDIELSLSAGLHYTGLDTGLKYKVLTPGSEVSDSLGNSASADLPLPVFGGHALWHIGGDFYRYDEKRKALVGTRTDRAFRLGQPLRVTVECIDIARRQLDLLLAE